MTEGNKSRFRGYMTEGNKSLFRGCVTKGNESRFKTYWRDGRVVECGSLENC